MEKKKILIIDDDELVRLVVAKIADRHGAIVAQAGSGEAGMEILKRDVDYDVIFLDLMMPQMSGWDVLEIIKKNSRTQTTPVVIMSGAPISPEEKKKLEGKVFAFINKHDFSIAAFEELLAKVL